MTTTHQARLRRIGHATVFTCCTGIPSAYGTTWSNSSPRVQALTSDITTPPAAELDAVLEHFGIGQDDPRAVTARTMLALNPDLTEVLLMLHGHHGITFDVIEDDPNKD